MGFPRQVNSSMAIGKPGTKATDNPVYYAAGQNVAGPNGVTAGRFAWVTVASEDNEIYSPNTYANTGTGAPDGFVEALTLQTYIDDINDASMVIGAGQAVNIAKSGDYFASVTAAATVGQSVYAKLDDGAIVSAAAGAPVSAGATLAGYVDTGWKVSKGTDGAGIIIISRQ